VKKKIPYDVIGVRGGGQLRPFFIDFETGTNDVDCKIFWGCSKTIEIGSEWRGEKVYFIENKLKVVPAVHFSFGVMSMDIDNCCVDEGTKMGLEGSKEIIYTFAFLLKLG